MIKTYKNIYRYIYTAHCHVYVTYVMHIWQQNEEVQIRWMEATTDTGALCQSLVLKGHRRQILHVKFTRVFCVRLLKRMLSRHMAKCCNNNLQKEQVPYTIEGSGSIFLLLIDTIVNTRKTMENVYLLGKLPPRQEQKNYKELWHFVPPLQVWNAFRMLNHANGLQIVCQFSLAQDSHDSCLAMSMRSGFDSWEVLRWNQALWRA